MFNSTSLDANMPMMAFLATYSTSRHFDQFQQRLFYCDLLDL